MLYVTTRSDKEIYTVHRALSGGRGPDGGIFMPRCILPFSPDELKGLIALPFSRCVEVLLNRVLGAGISGLELQTSAGNLPVELRTMGNRILIAESWHNAGGSFSWLIRNIGQRIHPDYGKNDSGSSALEIGVRIAAAFGIYCEIVRQGLLGSHEPIDISLVAGNFYGPVSLWIAEKMGLPLKNIVGCCNENNSLWELFRHGELRTDRSCIDTVVPEADVAIPEGLECFVRLCCGPDETERYLEAVRTGKKYCPDEAAHGQLCSGMQVSVVSSSAVLRTIPGVWSTGKVLLSSGGALAYGGLLDYRVRTGESRLSVVLDELAPRPAGSL